MSRVYRAWLLASRAASSKLQTLSQQSRASIRSSSTSAKQAGSEAGYNVYKQEGLQGLKSVIKKGQDRNFLANVLATLLGGTGLYVTYLSFQDPEAGKYRASVDFTNWSATHSTTAKRVYEPETEEEVLRIVQLAHTNGWRTRVVGSGISPNGMGFSEDCMISMGLMDKVLEIDKEKMQVRVQAGARVQDVVDALRPHGLALQSLASVKEQQIGGFTQVSAHGTGARIPPVDEQVVALRLAAPGLGSVIRMSRDDEAVFNFAKVGLGSLGVVTELTLQCVPAHRLLEHMFVASRAEVERKHARWLRTNKHVRYMWIPYTDSVVVVHCNETKRATAPSSWFSKPPSMESRLEKLRMLLMSHSAVTLPDIQELSATQLRDELIKLKQLDTAWIKQVNAAEAEYWKRSSGYRVGWSDEILGFDCGGQQWVLEVAFPTGTLERPAYKDLEYMKDLYDLLEKNNIPAPAPIEQRWTSSSSSPMSPAHSSNPSDVHSWVGIIMYLPVEDPTERSAIGDAFREYSALCEKQLLPKYGAKWHWAKLEPGEGADRHKWIQAHLKAHYPVDQFNTLRHSLDPDNNFGNSWLNAILPLPRKSPG